MEIRIKKKHSQMLKKIEMVLNKPEKESYLECCNSECSCEENLYNEKIYGVIQPCYHQILKPLIENNAFEEFCNSNRKIDMKNSLIHCLQNFPKDYQRNKASAIIHIEIRIIIESYMFY